jgi:hypothetical protein
VDDPALGHVGEIVHEADLGDDRYEAPQAPGLDAVIRGLGRTRSDAELTRPIYDGLYERYRDPA